MVQNRGSGGGSGVYIGQAMVVTCDHLFRDKYGKQETGRIVVTFPNGQSSEAVLVQSDKVWDLAILKITHPPKGILAAIWSKTMPKIGDKIFSCGFGKNGKLRWNPGKIRGFGGSKGKSPNQNSGPADTVIAQGSAIDGDSGGPIFNDRGEICGILWGSGNGEIVGTQIGRCLKFGGSLFRQEQPKRLPPIEILPSPPIKPVWPSSPENHKHSDLQIGINRNTSSIEALKREFEITTKNTDELIKLIKEGQKRTQNLTILIQRNSKEIEKISSDEELKKLLLRMEWLERNMPAYFKIIADKQQE